MAASLSVSAKALNPYDPQYDPLVAKNPGHGTEYAPTYWVGTAGDAPVDDGPVSHDMDVDVAIVGAGFTGLATALFLAREHGIKAVVLEANQTAWGCTSRNGGQGQNASGRLYRSQWIERWGKDTAMRLDAEIREGFETFKSLVATVPECEPQGGGPLYIAHRAEKLDFLHNETKVMRDVFGYDARMLSADEVREQYVDDKECHGAQHEPDGIGVHPLKLAFAYLRLARELGAKVHTSSPVQSFETRNHVHYLRTPGGVVRAKAVGFATGGYTSFGLHPSLDAKVMPILSNSMVTRPLTDGEIAATGFKTNEIITDTRTLRFYYRLLPDRRVQIGSRSAISGADAPAPKHMAVLRDGLARKFPALAGIQIDYSWWGWVDVSHDMMPRVTQPNAKESVFYALGYGGNGVAFSAHAGRRLAQRIAGLSIPQFDLPIYDKELDYPYMFNNVNLPQSRWFAPVRRFGQHCLFHWYHWKDEKKT